MAALLKSYPLMALQQQYHLQGQGDGNESVITMHDALTAAGIMSLPVSAADPAAEAAFAVSSGFAALPIIDLQQQVAQQEMLQQQQLAQQEMLQKPTASDGLLLFPVAAPTASASLSEGLDASLLQSAPQLSGVTSPGEAEGSHCPAAAAAASAGGSGGSGGGGRKSCRRSSIKTSGTYAEINNPQLRLKKKEQSQQPQVPRGRPRPKAPLPPVQQLMPYDVSFPQQSKVPLPPARAGLPRAGHGANHGSHVEKCLWGWMQPRQLQPPRPAVLSGSADLDGSIAAALAAAAAGPVQRVALANGATVLIAAGLQPAVSRQLASAAAGPAAAAVPDTAAVNPARLAAALQSLQQQQHTGSAVAAVQPACAALPGRPLGLNTPGLLSPSDLLSPAGGGNASGAGGLATAGGTLDSLEALLADKDLLAGVFVSPGELELHHKTQPN
jgi:hypothetical protein